MIELVDILDQHGPEVEYDLIRCGLRLRNFPDKGVSWGDLRAVIAQCRERSDSALWRALHPDDWPWDLQAQLLAGVIDELRALAYQHAVGSSRLRKPTKQPRPIPRPGFEPEEKRHGGEGALPVDEMSDWLGGPFAVMNN